MGIAGQGELKFDPVLLRVFFPQYDVEPAEADGVAGGCAQVCDTLDGWVQRLAAPFDLVTGHGHLAGRLQVGVDVLQIFEGFASGEEFSLLVFNLRECGGTLIEPSECHSGPEAENDHGCQYLQEAHTGLVLSGSWGASDFHDRGKAMAWCVTLH